MAGPSQQNHRSEASERSPAIRNERVRLNAAGIRAFALGSPKDLGKLLKKYLPDPKSTALTELTIRRKGCSFKIYRVLVHNHTQWETDAKNVPTVCEHLRLVQKNLIHDDGGSFTVLSNDYFLINFRGSPNTLHRRLMRLTAAPRTWKGASKEVEINGVTFKFYRVLRGNNVVLAIPPERAESLHKALDLEAKIKIENVLDTEAPVSQRGMITTFRHGQAKSLERLLACLPKKPEEHSTGACEVTLGDERFEFRRRLSNRHIVWAFSRSDVPKLKKALDVDTALDDIPRAAKGEIVISGKGLGKHFRGTLQSLIDKVSPSFPAEDSSVYAPNAYVLRKNGQEIPFERREVGSSIPKWACAASYKALLGQLFELEVKHKVYEVLDSEIVVSGKSLVAHFKGNYKDLLKKFADLLPPKKTGYGTRPFHLKVASQTFLLHVRERATGQYWAFAKQDKYRLAAALDIEPKIRREELVATQGVADAIALLGTKPHLLHRYLQLSFPEWTVQAGIDATLLSIKALRPAPTVLSQYGEFKYGLLPVRLTSPQLLNLASSEDSILVEGRADKRASYVEVAGNFRCRLKIDSEGAFRAYIPLHLRGLLNHFEVFAVDRAQNKISESVHLEVLHQDSAMSEDARFDHLVFRSGKVQSSRILEDLRNHMELSHLGDFTEDETVGFAKLDDEIGAETNDQRRGLLQAVKDRFLKVAECCPPLASGYQVYFYEKYIVFRLRELKARGDTAALLACDPGLGKTVCALLFAGSEPTVVCCPAPIVPNWLDNARRLLAESELTAFDGTYVQRDAALQSARPNQLVVPLSFLQGAPPERIAALSNPNGLAIFDESLFFANPDSKQSVSAKKLDAGFRLLIAAVPLRRGADIINVFQGAFPEDRRFGSALGVSNAFPLSSPQAVSALQGLVDQHTIRVRKDDVFKTYDPKLPLEVQKNRLPAKIKIDPRVCGEFELLQEQCEQIRLVYRDVEDWRRRFKPDLPMLNELTVQEGLYFLRLEAVRQIMNDPAYFGRSDLISPKHLKVQDIVERELGPMPLRKAVIFCRYRSEVEAYAKRFAHYGPRLYYGALDRSHQGYRVDENRELLRIQVDGRGNYLFNEQGLPLRHVGEGGLPITALEYERLAFQNAPQHRLLICTYASGAMGVPMTAADVVIAADLPSHFPEEYHANDRPHRIDPLRKKYSVTYYSLVSRYPGEFLNSVRGLDDDGHFNVGTFDQVQFNNLRAQERVFNRIMDGLGDVSDLETVHRSFAKKMPFLFSRKVLRRDADAIRSYLQGLAGERTKIH